MKEALIIRQRPFPSVLEIREITSLTGRGAISGETFKIISGKGEAYKLRYCSSLRKAKTIERNVRLFPKAFPHFYGRDRKFLLFDWIEGEHLAKSWPIEICFQLGQWMGEIHALENLDKASNAEHFFKSRFRVIKKSKIFDAAVLAGIRLKYKELRKGLKIDITLELNDLHLGNLMLDRKGRIYYVDEEGFGHKVKGLGFVKPLIMKSNMRSKGQQEAFWRGYNEFHDNRYFNRDYRKFVWFLQLVRTIATRVRTGADYQKEKEKLQEMIS